MLELDWFEPSRRRTCLIVFGMPWAAPTTSLSLQGLPCSVLWPIETRKKKQQPILTSKETSTELFTGLSPQSLIIDAGYDPWVSVDAVKHDTIETKKNLLSTRTTHTRSQCKVIFLNPQQLEEQQIIPGPTMSSEVIRRLWIILEIIAFMRNQEGLYKI